MERHPDVEQIQDVILHQFDLFHFNWLRFPVWYERGILSFTDWAHNPNCVFFEQSKNVYYNVQSVNGII